MKRILAETVLVVLGAFLIIDSLFLHLLTFDYNAVGLGVLDPYLQHWMWGILLVAAGLFDLYTTKK